MYDICQVPFAKAICSGSLKLRERVMAIKKEKMKSTQWPFRICILYETSKLLLRV